MRLGILLLLFATFDLQLTVAENYRALPEGERPDDSRLAELRTLNSYFPFTHVENKNEWKVRQDEIRRRILVSQGLWPEPTKTELNAVVHGRKEYNGYSVEKVYFESVPGNFVTGTLYRPLGSLALGKTPQRSVGHGTKYSPTLCFAAHNLQWTA